MNEKLIHWGTPLITALIGLAVGVITASHNASIADNRYFLERRVVAAENVANEFSKYMLNTTRLKQLREHLNSKGAPPIQEEIDSFKKTVASRSEAREKLLSHLGVASLYFGSKLNAEVAAFLEWEASQSILTADKMAGVKDWREWQLKIVGLLHEEINEEPAWFSCSFVYS